MYQSHVDAVQYMTRLCTGAWDAWCIISCLIFLTVNNEAVTHYLNLIYVAVERANLFCKVAFIYYTTITFFTKIFCFKQLSNFKTQAVSFALKLLINWYIPLHRRIPRNPILSNFNIASGQFQSIFQTFVKVARKMQPC